MVLDHHRRVFGVRCDGGEAACIGRDEVFEGHTGARAGPVVTIVARSGTSGRHAMTRSRASPRRLTMTSRSGVRQALAQRILPEQGDQRQRDFGPASRREMGYQRGRYAVAARRPPVPHRRPAPQRHGERVGGAPELAIGSRSGTARPPWRWITATRSGAAAASCRSTDTQVHPPGMFQR